MRIATILIGLAAPLLVAAQDHGTAGRDALATTIEVPFESHDGYAMLGKLTVPADDADHPLLVYVQTAEGMTVDMRRPLREGRTFDYMDLYRERLPPLGFAFFSYEGRGVRMGDAPPRYETIDRAVYDTSTLENKVRDALAAIEVAARQPGVDAERLFLIGASEGSLLAAETATRAGDRVRGLVLYSILASTLQDATRYMAGDGAFNQMNDLFDTNRDGGTSREEYEADARGYRKAALGSITFEQLDENGDGVFAAADLRALRKPLLDAIDSKNVEPVYQWLALTAAVSLPKGWLEDHFAHPPMWSFLARLDIPVAVLHGTADNLTPVAGTRELEAIVTAAEKTNIEFHYFDGLDHSLGLARYFAAGAPLPAGHEAILQFLRKHAR